MVATETQPQKTRSLRFYIYALGIVLIIALSVWVVSFVLLSDEALDEADMGIDVYHIMPSDAQDVLTSGNDVLIIDVRQRSDWQTAPHIDGAHLIPLETLPQEILERALDPDMDILVIDDTHGDRSMAAANILIEHGFTHVHNIDGGMIAWQAAGLPISEDFATVPANESSLDAE